MYNAERYLDECIRSALDQTYSHTEIIAVDDGSTDTSAEILDGYADRIRVHRKENGGTASALNLGARRMSGDWFKWLSADDLLKPHAVATLAAGARCLGDAAMTSILYAAHDTIGVDGAPVTIEGAWPADYSWLPPLRRAAVLLDHFYGNAITSMFHRSTFSRCGPFDEHLGFNEDYEFWLRCCLVHGYTMHYVDSVVASSRVHGAQLSTAHAGAGALAKEEQLKAHVLNMLPSKQRRRYLSALARYRHGPPHVRACRRARDAALRMLPGPAAAALNRACTGAWRRLAPAPPRR